MLRTIARWVSVGLLLASPARAQDAKDAPQKDDRIVNGGVQPMVIPQFDPTPFVFGGSKPEDVRKKFEEALAQEIRLVDRKYELTAAQQKKLKLAGGHDIKRFFDEVEEIKSDYARSNGDWNKISQRVFRLQRATNQPHVEILGEGSMFAKTLRKVPTAEQVARQAKVQYRDRVYWAACLLSNRLALSEDQRKALVDLVVEQTPPLGRYGDSDYDAILYQISRVPREKLVAFLDDAQYRGLTIRFEQAKRMEAVLFSEGYLTPEEPKR